MTNEQNNYFNAMISELVKCHHSTHTVVMKEIKSVAHALNSEEGLTVGLAPNQHTYTEPFLVTCTPLEYQRAKAWLQEWYLFTAPLLYCMELERAKNK